MHFFQKAGLIFLICLFSLVPVYADCIPDWKCGSWEPACDGKLSSQSVVDMGIQGISTRVYRWCRDLNGCNTDKPVTQMYCVTEFCTWECSDWSECRANQQTRLCTKDASCNSVIPKPPESKPCIAEKTVTAQGTFSGGAGSTSTRGSGVVTFPIQGGPVQGTWKANSVRESSSGDMYQKVTTSASGKLGGKYSGGEGGTVGGAMTGTANSNIFSRAGKYTDQRTAVDVVSGSYQGKVYLSKGVVQGTWEQPAIGSLVFRGPFTFTFTPIKIDQNKAKQYLQKEQAVVDAIDELKKEAQEKNKQSELARLRVEKKQQEIDSFEKDGSEDDKEEEVDKDGEEEGEDKKDADVDKPDLSELQTEQEQAEKELEKTEQKLDDLSYMERQQVQSSKESVENLKSILENLKFATSDPGKLKVIAELESVLEGMERDLANIDEAMEIYNVLFGVGPAGDWQDITYEDAKPGLWTRATRGLKNFFNIRSKQNELGHQVSDVYQKMAEHKKEQDFYAQSLDQRLMQYAYSKASSKAKEVAAEKTQEVVQGIIGKSGSFASAAITKPLQVVIDESKIPGIGEFYLAYEDYRKTYNTHEAAINQMQIDIEQGGIKTSATKGLRAGGIETITESPYFGVQNREILFESFNQVYKHNN